MRRKAALAVSFSVVLAIMIGHEAEHVAQILQKNALDASCPTDCRGVLGFVFDLEWVHFAYNVGIEGALLGIVGLFRLWRNPWLVTAVALQGYHVVEHVEKLQQWLGNGHHSPTPGILGMHFSLVELHFVFNTTVFLLVVAGYVSIRAWRGIPGRALAVGAALSAVALVGSGWMYAERPPTIRLAVGVHEGPIVLDRPSRLVGSPGAVVEGGIVVRSDYVVVRDVTVRGGENGIVVEDATNVVLDGVTVEGAELDGINVRRASVTIRDCRIGSFSSAWSMGIDISFAFDLPPSLVEGCRVEGAREGLVSHFAKIRFRDNSVVGATLRAITVTEMSMGLVEENHVESARGVGIYCGDYSMCTIVRNRVTGTYADPASDDETRAGYAIQSHFGAKAVLRGNKLEGDPGRIGAFADGTIRYD
jgi:hypothetical protein